MYRAIASLLSGGLLGKLLGVARELLLADLFGTTGTTAAYRAAQTATLIPTAFFTSETLNAGFIPLYVRYLREDPGRARTLFWSLLIVLDAIAVAVALGLIVGARLWTGVLLPGFPADMHDLTVRMVWITALGVPFYVQAVLFCYLELGHGRYRLTSLRASAQSIGLIAGTVAAFVLRDPLLLAWGFTGGYIVFAFLGGWILWRDGLLGWPQGGLWPDCRVVLAELWRIFRPLLLLPLFYQGNITLERAVASFLGVPVVAALDYAKMITETGLVLVAVPLGFAGLAELSRVPPDAARRQLQRLLPLLLLVTVPISVFLAIHSRPVVEVLYARGAFNAESVASTAPIVAGFAIGFWAQVISYMLVKALNAQFRNREVVVLMIAALALNAAVNLFTYQYLGPFALGLGTSVYALVLFVLTVRSFRLWGSVRGPLGMLALGAALYGGLATWARVDGKWMCLARGAAIFGMFWVGFVAAVPSLRNMLASVFRREESPESAIEQRVFIEK